ncbi:unnamed protein product [Brassicogethes aeneus]|uniref:FLYWCH-type domain-containing protein n=1 Tax=Brassicogethes aeneus TaxID=1431903 RepID=A0A9P0B1A4_BRAAE|nr:unnamed protein product [Brassicogethes aeneus]
MTFGSIQQKFKVLEHSCLIYFDMGHKNPKIVYKMNDYLIYRKLPDKTVWLCAHYHRKDRCKAKVVTKGKDALVQGNHNHLPTYKQKFQKHMVSQLVNVHFEEL